MGHSNIDRCAYVMLKLNPHLILDVEPLTGELCYARIFNHHLILDIATLTGGLMLC